FRESLRRITNGAHQFFVDIGAAADKIDHLLRDRIIKHSVDGEIAALRVLFRRRKMHSARMPSINVSVIGTKGRHLELKTVLHHDDHTKMGADCERAWEKRLHGFGARVGNNVVIFRDQTAYHVTYAASREVRDMAALTQTRGNYARHLFHGRGFHRITLAASLCEAQRA